MILEVNTARNREVVARALHKYHCLNGESFYQKEEIFYREPLVGGNCEDLIQKAIDTLWSANAEERRLWYNKADVVLRALDSDT